MISWKDECPLLLLQGAIALINSCTIEQLQHIPNELCGNFLVHLKRLWGQAHKRRLSSAYASCDWGNEFCVSNIRTMNLAESIFRLCMNYELHLGPIDFDFVSKSIFDVDGVGFQEFLSEIWEISPMLIRNGSKAPFRQNSIFSPFIQYLGLKEEMHTFLPSMLKCFISCREIASDELDILHIIKEIKNYLGPIIYHQDIRVLKTQCGETESHYFEEQFRSTCSLAPHSLDISDIMKCGEAFNDGYSIAVRGMELRLKSVAAIADALASLLGQPSAGVNMYLTPSNSQGLARHSDDHCVFVCQLIGVKRWTIFPTLSLHLPHLYEPSDSLRDLEDESHKIEKGLEFVLKEGDVLYIPRGFPHEARTSIGDDGENVNSSNGFSLHLTLAIEIEPPFEWEGFLHASLFCWHEKQKRLLYKSVDSMPWSLHLVSLRLLHIAIKLSSNVDQGFRKACLVGAMPFSPDTKAWLRTNQRTTFGYLISRINTESKFSDAAEHLVAAVQKNEDPLEHLGWMKHLYAEGDSERLESFSSAESRYLFGLLNEHNDTAEAAFMQAKYNFAHEAKFQDTEQRYKQLLENYRKVRKQYRNGMLSLHHAIQEENEAKSVC